MTSLIKHGLAEKTVSSRLLNLQRCFQIYIVSDIRLGNIRLGWECLAVTNAVLNTAVKSFIVSIPKITSRETALTFNPFQGQCHNTFL
jgi:hypothetical protein